MSLFSAQKKKKQLSFSTHKNYYWKEDLIFSTFSYFFLIYLNIVIAKFHVNFEKFWLMRNDVSFHDFFSFFKGFCDIFSKKKIYYNTFYNI